MPPICVPSPRRLNNQASNRKTSRGRIYNILWNQPERRTRCYPPPCPSARSLWLRRARISQSFFEPSDLGPRCRNSRGAAWAHNRTSSSHSSLVGPRAPPSQRPQSACSHQILRPQRCPDGERRRDEIAKIDIDENSAGPTQLVQRRVHDFRHVCIEGFPI